MNIMEDPPRPFRTLISNKYSCIYLHSSLIVCLMTFMVLIFSTTTYLRHTSFYIDVIPTQIYHYPFDDAYYYFIPPFFQANFENCQLTKSMEDCFLTYATTCFFDGPSDTHFNGFIDSTFQTCSVLPKKNQVMIFAFHIIGYLLIFCIIMALVSHYYNMNALPGVGIHEIYNVIHLNKQPTYVNYDIRQEINYIETLTYQGRWINNFVVISIIWSLAFGVLLDLKEGLTSYHPTRTTLAYSWNNQTIDLHFHSGEHLITTQFTIRNPDIQGITLNKTEYNGVVGKHYYQPIGDADLTNKSTLRDPAVAAITTFIYTTFIINTLNLTEAFAVWWILHTYRRRWLERQADPEVADRPLVIEEID